MPVELAPQTLAKADPELRRALAGAAPGAVLPVMATLAATAPPPPASPQDRERWARERAEEFEAETAELVAELEARGASDVTRLWIARALSARLPVAAIDAAGRRPEVVRLELVVPRTILL